MGTEQTTEPAVATVNEDAACQSGTIRVSRRDVATVKRCLGCCAVTFAVVAECHLCGGREFMGEL
jgi:hypothetical protein